MKKQLINYETLRKITEAVSQTKDPEDVVLLTVESVRRAMKVKGCMLFLVDRKSDELVVAGSSGLSDDYVNKGPVSSLKSIADSLKDGPVAIHNVSDDPRIQYPEEAVKEGIASIMSVPLTLHGNVMGALRVYTAELWDFTLEDVNFVQAVAQIVSMAIDMCRINKGLKTSIEILKTMRDPAKLKIVR
ncbi:MAG: GAF domain-containing protein [Desulfobacterales bacterium]|nr:GAF domain-containing protein [Desulfobacterales bacterium]